jgi:hypothetical protein
VIKRKFTTMTAELLALRDWLAEHNIARVGMESTSDYWRPVFYLLEQRFDCWLLNARHMRAVPGRKTDMTDAEWICDLVALGLVRPSFVPPPPIRRLRDLTRRRAILLAERTREKQRMEKLLEDAGVKLSVVATDIFGKSGRAMLNALIAGERDPKVLAELAMGRLRKKIPALAEALVGRFDDHHAFLAHMICDHIDTISRMVAELNKRIDTEIEPCRIEVELLGSLPGGLFRGNSHERVELQPDNCGDCCVERAQRSPVVGVENSPGFQVGDDAFDHSAGLIDGRVERLLPVKEFDALDLLDGRDHAASDIALVAGPGVGRQPAKGPGLVQAVHVMASAGDRIGDPHELTFEGAHDLNVHAGRLVLPRVQAWIGCP